MPPVCCARRPAGVALEELMLGLGVEGRRRLVQYGDQRLSRMKPRARASFCHWP